MNNQYENVRIGIEVGDHGMNYEKFIEDLKINFDLSRVGFMLIYTQPVDIPERLWLEWAAFFKENDIYFAFLYTQQRGAPKGKISHLTEELVQKMKGIAGEYFVGDMIGETGGMASWQEGYYEDIGMEKPIFDDMQEAKDNYVKHVCSLVEIDRRFKVPAVLAVEATTFNRYNFEAGVDYSFVEMMCGNPEVMFASVRGACKAYGREWWASHIAQEWYGGFRNNDTLKHKRLTLAYYYSFLAGAKFIYPESGNFKIASYGDNYGAESDLCKAYRSAWNKFSDFVQEHKRPVKGPKVKIGILQGNLDSWTGWGGATVWNQFDQDSWSYGAAEQSWEYLNRLFEGDKWHATTNYGEVDQSASVPYGQYDIVPIEASVEVLQQYSCLILLGWNTMTEIIYENLKQYVYQGGRLFMSVSHLNKSSKRGGEIELINNGDYSDLFGCIVKGEGKKVNWGVKFIEESSIPGYQYPYAKDGVCDPICACGIIRCADVQLTTAKVVALLADKFIKWREESPALLVENAYGKGFASLITSWDYPGEIGLNKFMQVMMKTIIAGEQKDSDIQVISNDKIRYSVYPMDDGSYVIYLLNTDYNVANKAKVVYGDKKVELEIESCEMRIVNASKDDIKINL